MEYTKTEQDMIEETNRAISELVYDKDDLQKAYNYYNGKRDEEQFRFLEENFGVGSPISVSFTPLIRKHVDALIGEYLGSPIIPKVSCKDQDTISKIMREKELTITKEVYTTLQKKAKNKILDFLQTGDKNNLTDPYVGKEIEALIANVSENFVSKFEIAAQDVIQYIIQSRQMDLQTKLKTLLLDLLITGYTFYQVKPTSDGGNIQIEVLNPLNTFIDKNPDSPYIKDSYRAVIRRWMTKSQILNKYGAVLSKEDKQSIKDMLGEDKYDAPGKYVRLYHDQCQETPGLMADHEVTTPGYPYNKVSNYNYRLVPVYEVEWLETDSDYVMQRYKTIRIGEDIFVLTGKDETVQRSITNPTYASLSVNGVYFDNRNNEPFSFVIACMHLQDKYDLLHFYRDTLIANSGSSGDWLDVSMLPAILGTDTVERLQKWIAMKKQGLALIDTSQEGRYATGQSLNTTFSGYDDTAKLGSIQAIQLAIESIENTVCSISGVFRERLNGIEQRDAVTNVKVSANNSFIITKHWFQQMDLVTEEILSDSLNLAKIVYKNGLTGTIILGEQYQKIFTALPDNFTTTDFDVHVTANSDIAKDLETIKAIVPQLMQSGMMGMDTIFEVMTSKSLSQAKSSVRKATDKFKKENDQLKQAQEQLMQFQQQLQQLQQQNQQLTQQLQQYDERKMKLEEQKAADDVKIRWFNAQTERSSVNNENKNDDKRTEAEIEQLNDGNPNNDRIIQMRH